MNFYRRLVMPILGIVVGLLVSLGIDSTAGKWIRQSGYYYVHSPQVTEIYDTNEYQKIATTSAQGIRNEMVTIPKSSGVYRVLALGDSFTFGWGVSAEESWPKQLESLLQKSHPTLEVINAGGVGASLKEENTICRVYADQMEADAIVVGLYGFDDLYQHLKQEESDRLTPLEQMIRLFWPSLTSLRTSRMLAPSWHHAPKGSVIRLMEQWKRAVKIIEITYPQFFASLPVSVQEQLRDGLLNPSFLAFPDSDASYLIKLLDPHIFNQVLTVTDRLLDELRSCAGKRPVTLLFLPSADMISEEFFPYRNDLGFKTDNALLTVDPDQSLASLSQKHGMNYISLLQQFRQEQCSACYYRWDIHFTPLGHEKTAKAVQPIIETYLK